MSELGVQSHITVATPDQLIHLTFLQAPLQTVTDSEASLRQEVVKNSAGEGLTQRLQGSQTSLSTKAEKERVCFEPSFTWTPSVLVSVSLSHLLSIRLSIHCLSLSSVSS